MVRLNNWLSPDVLHALGWALVHSLWQCLAVAALAAALMAFLHRPALRYLIAVGALALMLATPVTTFFLLLTPAATIHIAAIPVPETLSATPGDSILLNQAPNTSLPSVSNIGAHASPVLADTLAVTQNRLLSPTVLPWLVAAWLCGVAFFSLRFAGGYLLLEHKRRNRSAALDDRILALCQEVQRQLGLDRIVRYRECGWLQAPAVIGWLRPVVLLPVVALTGLSEAQLRAVIAHELAHIRRFDVLVNLFQVFAETLLFYHPAIWWLNRRIRAERELCCDEIAVAASGSRLEYAQALTLMAAWESAPNLAMAANRGPLSERVFRILGRKSRGAGQRLLGLTGSVLFFIAALAAANALLDIAAPPLAQAKEGLKAALSAVQIAGQHVLDQASPITVPAAKSEHADGAITPTPAGTEQSESAPQLGQIVPPTPDLSGVLPHVSLVVPKILASNAVSASTTNRQIAPAATPDHAAPVGPANGKSPEILAPIPPPIPPSASAVNKNLASIAAPPVVANQQGGEPVISGAPSTVWKCGNESVVGRVLSPNVLQMNSFVCLGTDAPAFYASHRKDTCQNGDSDPADLTSADRLAGALPCSNPVRMNVQLANPADVAKMQIGKIVRLRGSFSVALNGKSQYITTQNASILEVDPTTPAYSGPPKLLVCQPPQLADLAKQFEQQLCVQGDIVSNLSVTRPALESAIHSLATHSAGSVYSGNPGAITCHKRIYERWPSSVTCGFNSFWKSWVSAGPSLPDTPMGVGNYGTSDANVGPAMIGGALWNR